MPVTMRLAISYGAVRSGRIAARSSSTLVDRGGGGEARVGRRVACDRFQTGSPTARPLDGHPRLAALRLSSRHRFQIDDRGAYVDCPPVGRVIQARDDRGRPDRHDRGWPGFTNMPLAMGLTIVRRGDVAEMHVIRRSRRCGSRSCFGHQAGVARRARGLGVDLKRRWGSRPRFGPSDHEPVNSVCCDR